MPRRTGPARPAVRTSGAERAKRATEKTVRRLTESAATRAAPTEAGAVSVGMPDPVSGEFQAFGLLGVTTLGAPFRLGR